MTAEPLKPLPCPWCQKPPTIRNVFNMFGMVESVNVYCPEHTHGFKGKTQQEAIAAWNRRAKSIGNSDELWDWLARRIRNVTYGYQKAADGYYYHDGYHDALEWVLSLRREDAE